MSYPGLFKGLKDASDQPIEDLNADWTSKWYSFAKFVQFSLQLGWDNATVEGELFLDYSSDPDGSIFTVKSAVTLDGSFNEALFLDADLGVAAYRLRFTNSSGTANLTAFHNHKGA